MTPRRAAVLALLALLWLPVAPVQAQAFGRLEGLQSNAAVFAFARPGDATKRIYVWGAVQRPGLYEVEASTDLSELLSLAGGPVLPVRSDEVEHRVTLRLYHPEGDVRRLTFEAPVDSLLQRVMPAPREGDVVEVTVAQRRIRSWRDNLSYVSVGASLLTAVVSIVSILVRQRERSIPHGAGLLDVRKEKMPQRMAEARLVSAYMLPPRIASPVWRVFYTRPNAERRAEERLAAQGLTAFVPVRTVEKMWSDRKKQVEEPLFRGYLFARVDERARLTVLEDEGVVRCLRFDGAFAQVSEDEIALLRRLAAVPERLEAVLLNRFPVGQTVTVTEGPLAGLQGRVLQHRRVPTLIVEVHSIRQAVRVHLRADWLQPLELAA